MDKPDGERAASGIGAAIERVAAAFAPASPAEAALPVHFLRKPSREADVAALPAPARAFAEASGFEAAAGELLLAPGADGLPGAALIGLGAGEPIERVGQLAASSALGRLGRPLRLVSPADAPLDPAEAVLEWACGRYRYDRFRSEEAAPLPRLAVEGVEPGARALAEATFFARDLVNAPTSALGPSELAAAAIGLAAHHGAETAAMVGAELLEAGYPLIHAVGRAGPQAPRLVDLRWGREGAPRLTIVGKGVCFDTGGLDLKPPRFMRNMKKDMGGAAAALALAHWIMATRLPVRLRVLLPIVENSVSAEAFRPGDVLKSRKGLTIEIGDTDAEGRLILADALAEADAEAPDLLVDLATLTGAARVAVGPDIAPFYTRDDALADALTHAGRAAREPMWRLPLHQPYAEDLASKVADLCNVSSAEHSGSITAALFLGRFVEKAAAWLHLDVFAWNPKARPGRPEGGEASAVRALTRLLAARYRR